LVVVGRRRRSSSGVVVEEDEEEGAVEEEGRRRSVLVALSAWSYLCSVHSKTLHTFSHTCSSSSPVVVSRAESDSEKSRPCLRRSPCKVHL